MHFDRGVEHYSEGNYDAALAEFQRTYELRPSYKLLFNLAQVQVELHDNAAALRLFNEYLRGGGANIAPERLSEVEQEIQRLRQSVAELTVNVDVQGARIFVNAAPVGISPLREPMVMNAGRSLISVEKAGYITFVESLNITGADHKRLDVELKPLPAADTRQLVQAQPEMPGVPNMTPFWISMSATLVLGGATGTFGALSLHAHAKQNELLASYPGRASELSAARDRLQTFAVLTDVFAGATLVTGLVGLYFALSPPERRETVPARRTNVQLSASPAGVLVNGVF